MMSCQKIKIFSLVLLTLGGGLLLVTDVTVGQMKPSVQASGPIPMVEPEWFEQSNFSYHQEEFRTSTPELPSRMAEERFRLMAERKRIQDPRVIQRPSPTEQAGFPTFSKAQRLQACMSLSSCKEQLLGAQSGRKPTHGLPSWQKTSQEALAFDHIQNQDSKGVSSSSTRDQRLNLCAKLPACEANLRLAQTDGKQGAGVPDINKNLLKKPAKGLLNPPYSLTLNQPYFFSQRHHGNARLIGGQGHNGTYILQPFWPSGVDSSPEGKPFIRLSFEVPHSGWYLIDFFGTGAAAKLRVGTMTEIWDFRNSTNSGTHYIVAAYLKAGENTVDFWAIMNKSLTVFNVTVDSI
ncbi:MAG: hypothetical protein KC592_03645 [Nitrospira sp.]|nr:hypothetical protein [Nitrospira sp.]